jgi:hypothetical protein
MKKVLIVLLTVFGLTRVNAQVKDPVQWDFTAKKINETTYEVSMAATLEEGWHLYSQTTPTGGPVPTEIKFMNNPLVVIQGTAKESGKLEQRHEQLFGVDVKQYSDKASFVQTVKLKNKVKTTISGSVAFMTCNDHECLPPAKQKFSIALN